MTEIRSFNASNGNILVLTKDGDKVLLSKMDKTTGTLKHIASKLYARTTYGAYSPVKKIFRKGYDAEGNLIRSSKIPVCLSELDEIADFYIKDGAFEMKGELPTKYLRKDGFRACGYTSFKNIKSEQVTVNLKSLGNLARSYMNKALKYFAKVK
jgi:hypothetical protein